MPTGRRVHRTTPLVRDHSAHSARSRDHSSQGQVYTRPSAHRAECQPGQGVAERHTNHENHEISIPLPAGIETARASSAVLRNDYDQMRGLLSHVEAVKLGDASISDIKGARKYINTHRDMYCVHAYIDPRVFSNIYAELVRTPGEGSAVKQMQLEQLSSTSKLTNKRPEMQWIETVSKSVARLDHKRIRGEAVVAIKNMRRQHKTQPSGHTGQGMADCPRPPDQREPIGCVGAGGGECDSKRRNRKRTKRSKKR